jgi:uncharacterized membrane protein YeaQ/YmgE (transglycosylase-associated protein family)
MKTRAISLEKAITKEIIVFSILSFFAIFSPFFGAQAVTGPLVNAMLFIATILLGVRGATLLAVLPSIVALSVGFLPLQIAPLVPFIIIGNIILVVVFNHFQKDFWKGVVLSSFSKFFFLCLSSFVISEILFSEKIAKVATTMMSFPQLFTALIGGIIAYFILLLFENKKEV